MSSLGWIKLHRRILNSKVSEAPPCTREVWNLLLLEANHEKAKYRTFKIERGQLFRSYNDIIDKLHWWVGWRKKTYAKDQVKNAMKFLRNHGMIRTEKAPGGVLITICNYDRYQRFNDYESTSEDTLENTTETPAKHQENAIYNNNINIDNNNIIKNKLSGLILTEIKDNNIKIAYKFWQLIRDQHDRLYLKNESVENAICEDWVKPIHYLIDKKKKTIEEFEQVFLFLQENKWWEGRIVHTKKLIQKNTDGSLYFDFFLKLKRKEINETLPLSKEEISIALSRYFPNPTPHFVELFTEYQKMIHDKEPKNFKTNNLYFEISNLAKSSKYNQLIAVNQLNKSLKQKKDLILTQNKINAE